MCKFKIGEFYEDDNFIYKFANIELDSIYEKGIYKIHKDLGKSDIIIFIDEKDINSTLLVTILNVHIIPPEIKVNMKKDFLNLIDNIKESEEIRKIILIPNDYLNNMENIYDLDSIYENTFIKIEYGGIFFKISDFVNTINSTNYFRIDVPKSMHFPLYGYMTETGKTYVSYTNH